MSKYGSYTTSSEFTNEPWQSGNVVLEVEKCVFEALAKGGKGYKYTFKVVDTEPSITKVLNRKVFKTFSNNPGKDGSYFGMRLHHGFLVCAGKVDTTSNPIEFDDEAVANSIVSTVSGARVGAYVTPQKQDETFAEIQRFYPVSKFSEEVAKV